ncbi:DUF3159 domain-containing protein [Bifidobacterium aquikefiricola]|uniref:DUF3159 domain-containing protein n=1 Tax=Bifidobacterium aquikefiricola TaxID=3059038 RepID=A0AB39U984_9BIFI
MTGETDKSSSRTGIGSLAADDFSIMDAIGGVRGVIESLLPGLIFIVTYVATGNLGITVVLSLVEAAVQLVIRMVQRQSIMGALSGLFAVALCLVWAWLTKDARNYYVPGFITNIVWIVVLLISLAIKVPGIGACIEFLRHPTFSGFGAWLDGWRGDVSLYRAYAKVTALWIGLFAARLLVQLPMYVTDHVAWLGTARLVMGVPCFALVIWISWLLVADPLHRHAELNRKSDNTERQY